MSKHHWGEIPKQLIDDFSVPNVMADIERSMDKFCLAEYEDDSEVLKTENLFLPSMDPLMLYSISLHKYMIEMSRIAECAKDTNVIPPAAPPMPLMPDINVKHKRNNLNYMPKDNTPFTCGWEVDIPELSEAVVKKILTKCVATMFAHIGFETTHQSILDLLTDVLEKFFMEFCHKLVEAIDDEEKGSSAGFPHVIERILTDTGMGGIKGLNDYYQNRVVKYICVLQKRCKELSDQYALLQIPENISSGDKYSKVVRVKVENEDVEMHNSEVHFTSFDGESSALETGYQLLSSLEAEENLQSLGDVVEEEMASASPGVASLASEADVTSLSPFSKKKRYK